MRRLNVVAHVFLLSLIRAEDIYRGIDPLALQRFAEFNCFKLKTCTRGGVPVCGFDDTRRVLAQFEDICTLYQVNCEGKGVFMYVEENICEGQKRFELEYKPFDENSKYFIG